MFALIWISLIDTVALSVEIIALEKENMLALTFKCLISFVSFALLYKTFLERSKLSSEQSGTQDELSLAVANWLDIYILYYFTAMIIWFILLLKILIEVNSIAFHRKHYLDLRGYKEDNHYHI